MKIQTRLLALLCALVAVFFLSAGLLGHSQKREAEHRLAELRRERGELLDRLLDLTGQSLRGFAYDYSNWGEMLQFVDKPDPQWAAINIDASLPNFNAHAAWVVCPDGRQIYGTVRNLDLSLRTLPLAKSELLPFLRAHKFAHFFVRTGAGLLEFRTAPVQPSEDTARTSEAHGWLLVARHWDHAFQHDLQLVLGSRVSLLPADQPPPAAAGPQIAMQREFRDWRGQTVARLHTVHTPLDFTILESQNDYERILLAGFGIGVLLAATLGVIRWVLLPLRRIERSLSHGTPEDLSDLERTPDSLGRVARLVTASFTHRQNLEREIEERRAAERALRESREELRCSAELNTRLARDLHDGVIQSIYATGLGLESAKATLTAAPAATREKLEAAQRALNQTIREVRSFIHGLEPERPHSPGFANELRALAATLRSLHAIALNIQFATEPTMLAPREEVHALQIVRECVSNAIRHGEARTILIEFNLDGACPRLRIHDDGRGFDPATVRRGSGLANLSSRAAEIGANLDLISVPGKGTDIVLRFAHR